MPALTHLLDSDPHQTHALHGYMMDLGSSASHSLSTVKMPIPPTPTFYKLKWILHSAKWSALKCMVGGHLVPSYCRQPLPLSSSKVSPLLQRDSFCHSVVRLHPCFSSVCDKCWFLPVSVDLQIWITAQGSTWLLMPTGSVCEYLFVHSPTSTCTEATGRWRDVFLYYSPTLFFEAGPHWPWSSQLLIGCKLLVSTC